MSSDFASLNADIEKARSLSKDSGALLQKASGHAEKIASAVYHASQYFMKRKWYVPTFFLFMRLDAENLIFVGGIRLKILFARSG